MKTQMSHNNQIREATPCSFLRIISITGLLLLITATQVLAGPPDPKEVLNEVNNSVGRARSNGIAKVKNATNVANMNNLKNRVDTIYQNIESIKNSGINALNNIPEIANLIKVDASSTEYQKEMAAAIKSFAATANTLKDAQEKLLTDRVQLMEIEFNHYLNKLLPFLKDLEIPIINTIKHELEQDFPNTNVNLGNSPQASHDKLVKKLSEISGKSEADVLKPVALRAPRRVIKAEYTNARGNIGKDVTNEVNGLIRDHDGMFLKLDAWPNKNCAQNHFGDIAKGEDKVFWVRDVNGKEYFWDQKEPIFFIPPVRFGTGVNWTDNSGTVFGTGWVYKFISCSDNNEIIAVKSDGTLKHCIKLSEGPEDKWSVTKLDAAGSQWRGFTHVFAGPANTIYATKPDGTLLWFKTLGVGKWATGSGNTIGTGWNVFKHIFYGGNNVIYGIKPNGDLHWYKRKADNYTRGNFEHGSGSRIGTGWNVYSKIFATYPNHIYGIIPDGTLHMYKRTGSGKGRWVHGSGRVIGTGWQEFKRVFANSEGIIYAIERGGNLIWYKRKP